MSNCCERHSRLTAATQLEDTRGNDMGGISFRRADIQATITAGIRRFAAGSECLRSRCHVEQSIALAYAAGAPSRQPIATGPTTRHA